MIEDPKRATRATYLGIILRPIVRFCLKGTHPLREFVAILKQVYVEEALKMARERGETINVSRLATLTGVHRKDVKSILEEGRPISDGGASILIKVIGQWQTDPRFQAKSGGVLAIPYKAKTGASFQLLCKAIGTDVRPKSILDELKRAGVVTEKDSKLHLTEDYNRFEQVPARRFAFLAGNIGRLVESAEENLFSEPVPRNPHLRTEFDNVSEKVLTEIREYILEENIAFHKRLRERLATVDRDVNPDPDGEEGRAFTVTVGSFGRCYPTRDE